ncbi:PEP-CTERM sorting domain-containing protein [Desulfuromonas thiophila]|uniref:PEP-CTERM sorting domain-containing protein n=1 Tax=Desulfuromonas thiophila TaxID=57664 RepID=UPI0024A8BF22|nr:PEP-CTERM sorting domain-containing protein [Desulfuromonas thiophila]
MKKLLKMWSLACVALLLSAGSALAAPYAVDFDGDGSGTAVDWMTIYGWDLEATPTEQLNGYDVDMVTHQSLGGDGVLNDGDTFTEFVRLSVLNGLGPAPAYSATPVDGYYKTLAYLGYMPYLYADFNFTGAISNYDNGGTATTLSTIASLLDDSYTANFTGGTGTLFADLNGNEGLDFGEELMAFNLIKGDSFELAPSAFSEFGSTQITFAFEVDPATLGFSLFNDYFKTADGFADLEDMISKNWLLNFAQGGIAVASTDNVTPLVGTNGEEILIGFQETGFDAKFQAVPEPGTFILLGLGLVGLVSLNARRRSSK